MIQKYLIVAIASSLLFLSDLSAQELPAKKQFLTSVENKNVFQCFTVFSGIDYFYAGVRMRYYFKQINFPFRNDLSNSTPVSSGIVHEDVFEIQGVKDPDNAGFNGSLIDVIYICEPMKQVDGKNYMEIKQVYLEGNPNFLLIVAMQFWKMKEAELQKIDWDKTRGFDFDVYGDHISISLSEDNAVARISIIPNRKTFFRQ